MYQVSCLILRFFHSLFLFQFLLLFVHHFISQLSPTDLSLCFRLADVSQINFSIRNDLVANLVWKEDPIKWEILDLLYKCLESGFFVSFENLIHKEFCQVLTRGHDSFFLFFCVLLVDIFVVSWLIDCLQNINWCKFEKRLKDYFCAW